MNSQIREAHLTSHLGIPLRTLLLIPNLFRRSSSSLVIPSLWTKKIEVKRRLVYLMIV